MKRTFLFENLWGNKLDIKVSSIEGKVVAGFKRGSKLLGVPTANIEIHCEDILKGLINGVYFGEFFFKTNKNNNTINTNESYRAVLSIGNNPYFDNTLRTLEVFLIHYSGEDFYDEKVKLEIQGYIRPESSFEIFAELVTTIGYDIKQYS